MKRRHYVTIAGLLLCITLWWILKPDNHNPTYKGKRLSVWLQGYDSGDQHERAITDEVVRQIGTNAVSFLLHELGVNDSALKTKLVHLASRQGLSSFPTRTLQYVGSGRTVPSRHCAPRPSTLP